MSVSGVVAELPNRVMDPHTHITSTATRAEKEATASTCHKKKQVGLNFGERENERLYSGT